MPTTTETVQEVAEVASTWFETATRSDENEDRYTRTKDGAPEWVKDLVREAHGDFLPDDWRYDCIRAAVDFIFETDDPEAGEFADSQVDVYTGARIVWLGSNLQRASYCDEALSEGLTDLKGGVIELIGLGQYMEASEVFGSVLASLEALIDEEIEAAS